MKLESVMLIFTLSVIVELIVIANGLCLVRNTTLPNQYWSQCFRSNDYLADMKKVPVDVYGHTVSNSKIRIIRNGSYTRLGDSLQSIAVIYCGVEEIESEVFQGLGKLRLMNFKGNRLSAVKSSWFVGLSSLRAVSFQSNRLKHMENNFFSVMPVDLDILDISDNRLTTLPTHSIDNFTVSEIHFRHNPLTWSSQISMINWLTKFGIRHDYLNVGNMDPPYDLTKICAGKMTEQRLQQQVGEFLTNCVEDTSRGYLPTNADYTVNQVCRFLKYKPSPFLNCNK